MNNIRLALVCDSFFKILDVKFANVNDFSFISSTFWM